jgi:hypothetical protein
LGKAKFRAIIFRVVKQQQRACSRSSRSSFHSSLFLILWGSIPGIWVSIIKAFGYCKFAIAIKSRLSL